MTLQQARAIRAVMETAAESLDDKTASTAPVLFRRLRQDGNLISAGTRICWNGKVKRAAVDLWDTAETTPDAAPDLGEDIDYRDRIRIIPETITAGTAFSEGEQGWWGDVLYTSVIDNNVWTPEQYPEAWEEAVRS